MCYKFKRIIIWVCEAQFGIRVERKEVNLWHANLGQDWSSGKICESFNMRGTGNGYVRVQDKIHFFEVGVKKYCLEMKWNKMEWNEMNWIEMDGIIWFGDAKGILFFSDTVLKCSVTTKIVQTTKANTSLSWQLSVALTQVCRSEAVHRHQKLSGLKQIQTPLLHCTVIKWKIDTWSREFYAETEIWVNV